MKKLFTLLLAVAGLVSTASAKIIYLQNNWGQSNLNVCYGSTTNDGENSWAQLFSIGQWDNKDVYTVDLGEATYFKITYSAGETIYLTSSSFVEGKCYYFNYVDEKNVLDGPFDITVHTYSFTVDTDPDHDFGTLKIHLFKDGNPINGAWLNNPPMVKDDNVYSYTYRSIPNSGGIGVVFHNDNDADKTEDLGASEGANSYVVKYNNSAAKKIRKAEKVSTNGSGYCTYVNTDPIAISGAIAYGAEDSGSGNATAHAITDNVPAGTPMLIKGDASETYYFEVVGSGISLEYTNAFHAGSGVLSANEGGGFNYILKGDAFYLADENNVATNKAYLKLSAEAKGRVLRFFDNEETGINAIMTTADNSDACYSLSGQNIVNPTKGLYIRSGKKVLVK